MRAAALSVFVLTSTAIAAESGTASAAASTDSKATDAQAAKTPAPAKPAAPSSVAESMTLEAAIAMQLNNARSLHVGNNPNDLGVGRLGLTVFKRVTILRPGLTVLGLPSKLPEAVLPGRDETAPESMPPTSRKDKGQPGSGPAGASTQAK